MVRVSTKAGLKIKIKEWVEERGEQPFTTVELQEGIKTQVPNVYKSVNRLSNYIKGISIADYDKQKKKWKIKIKP